MELRYELLKHFAKLNMQMFETNFNNAKFTLAYGETVTVVDETQV